MISGQPRTTAAEDSTNRCLSAGISLMVHTAALSVGKQIPPAKYPATLF
nr:MAG TPA: hypothetical protein [Caudoviricetes sp.]